MITRIPPAPDPVAVTIGPMPIHWYGVGYGLGLFVAFGVMIGQARRRVLDTRVLDNGGVWSGAHSSAERVGTASAPCPDGR